VPFDHQRFEIGRNPHLGNLLYLGAPAMLESSQGHKQDADPANTGIQK
jgi:hypothetical protein